MNKFTYLLSSVAIAAAGLCSTEANAAPVMERLNWLMGDAQGEIAADQWSKAYQCFYDRNGKIMRRTTLGAQYDGTEPVLQNITTYTYDEAGNLVEAAESKASATSPDNVDREYRFDISNRWVYQYNDKNQVVRQYYQAAKKNYTTNEYSWGTNLSQFTEFSYNDDGTVATEEYWPSRTFTSDFSGFVAKASSYVTTYTYGDQGNNPVEAVTVGTQDYNNWKTIYDYDDKGHLIGYARTYTKGTNEGVLKERKEYTYNGDFLTEDHTYDKNGDTKKTVYEMIDGDPNHYTVQEYTYYAEKWSKKATSNQVFLQDYAGMENYVPEIKAESVAGSSDVDIHFALPDLSGKSYVVKVFSDGAAIATLDQAALSEAYDGTKWYTFSNTGLKNGDHEYFVQILFGEEGTESHLYTESYISDITTVSVEKEYPAVKNLQALGYTLKRTYVEEEDDPDYGYTPAHWLEEYKLVLSWTPLTAEETADLGFTRYDVYTNYHGSALVAQFTDINTAGATIDWETNASEVWVVAKYGENTAACDRLTINLDELPDLSQMDPLEIYGVQSDNGSPAFMKADLSKPGDAATSVWNLWGDSQIDLYRLFGGVSVDEYYYALYEGDSDGLFLGAFDMTNKEMLQIGDELADTPNDLAYDAASGTAYAVVPLPVESDLFSISLNNATLTKVNVGLPAYTYLITSAGNGSLYAIAKDGTGLALYHVDMTANTYTKVENATFGHSNQTYSSLSFINGTVYFTCGTNFYSVDPETGIVTTHDKLARGFNGITTVMSSELPDLSVQPAGGKRLLVKSTADNLSTEHFYNLDNKLVRTAEQKDGKVVRYTKNSYNEAGEVEMTQVYELVTDLYGLEEMQLVSTSTYEYAYNEEGNLETMTVGNGETVEKVLNYYYSEGSQPDAIMTMDGDENMLDIAMFQYDENGNKVSEGHTADMLSGEMTSLELWTYFPGTDIVSEYKKCDPANIDEQTGDPAVLESISYTMVDNDSMHMLAESSNGTVEELFYADYAQTAEKAQMQFMAMPIEDAVNSVAVAMGLPALYQTDDFRVRLYRDGSLVKEFLAQEFVELLMSGAYIDGPVANGDHEYFAQAMKCISGFDYLGLQISEINEVSFNTELPAVTDIAYVAHFDVDATDTTPGINRIVAIAWLNPEYPAEYGFESNNIFLVDGETPVAGEVVTEADATNAIVSFGTATSGNVMVQTRYAIGAANSEVKFIDTVLDGVSDITAGNISVSIAGKVVTLSSTARVRVFNAAGVLVADELTSSLNLNGHNGVHLITVTDGNDVTVIKAAL